MFDKSQITLNAVQNKSCTRHCASNHETSHYLKDAGMREGEVIMFWQAFGNAFLKSLFWIWTEPTKTAVPKVGSSDPKGSADISL
jgi:hypothetical protein